MVVVIDSPDACLVDAARKQRLLATAGIRLATRTRADVSATRVPAHDTPRRYGEKNTRTGAWYGPMCTLRSDSEPQACPGGAAAW